MSFSGEAFSKLLLEAAVKEDYTDLGLPEEDPKSTVLVTARARRKSNRRMRSGSVQVRSTR